MEICSNYINNNTTFTSKCNPIKPVTITTKLGKVRIYEPTDKEVYSKNFLWEVADIFCKNFSTYTKDPGWLLYSKPGNEKLYKGIVEYIRCQLLSQIYEADGHLSLLVARDKNKKMCGACLSRSLDDVPGTFDTTMYIDSIAINEDFRGNGLGRIFMEKVIDADKDHFTDIFLVGEKLAEGFYKKLGFKKLNPKKPDQKKVIDYIAIDRDDYPKYVTLLTKPIQTDKPRWYKLAAKAIDITNEKISTLYRIQD